MTQRETPASSPADDASMEASYRQALSLHGKGELHAAEALYEQILAAMPESFHALHMLGVLRGQRHDPVRSEELLARAVALDPDVAAAHAHLGHARRSLGRLPEALASYDRALELQPDNVRALRGRGMILWGDGKVEAALACYEHLLHVEPGYVDGWIVRGAALATLGRDDEANESYRQALQRGGTVNPDKMRHVLAALNSGGTLATSSLTYVRELFDRYANEFDEHLVDRLHYRTPQLLVDQLRPLLPGTPLDVLDLGCGTGLCGPLLRPSARSLTGLDLSPKMLDEAALKQVYDTLIAGDIVTFLSAQDAAFDVIVAADVFCYIGDLGPAFASARAALRPAGLFAFSTEINRDGDLRLLPSLRFAHAESYLRRLAAAGGWHVESLVERPLRQEKQEDVLGHLTILRRGDL